MTDQVSTIGIGVDSRTVVDARVALDQMAASGQKSENVIQRLAAAATEFAGGLRQGAVQALDEHRKQAELAATATKKLGEETTVATSKIASGMGAADGALRNFLVGAISGTAVVAAVAKEFGNFNHQIDQLAQLDDAAQAIGETIEKLSGLEGVAKVTNFSFGMVTASLARLTKGLAGSDDETKGAAYALKQLGIEARDSEGKLRSAVDITKEVADALGKAENSTNKTAYAQAIYGRGAAALIPYLNDLAKANLEGAIATTQQAEAATNYRDAQGALALESTKLYNVISGAVLPVFTQVIEGMTRAKSETGSLNSQIKLLAEDGSLARWSQNAVIGIGYVIDAARAVPVVFKIVGAALAGAANEAVNFADTVAGVFTVVTSTSNPVQLKEGFEQARTAVNRMGQGVSFAREDIDALSNTFTAGSFAQKFKDAFAPDALKMYNAELQTAATVLPDFQGKTEKAGKAARFAADETLVLAKSIETLTNAQTKTEFKIQTGAIDYAIEALKKLTASGRETAGSIEQVAALQEQKFAMMAEAINREKDTTVAAVDAIVAASVRAENAGNAKGVTAAAMAYRVELAKLLTYEEREAALSILRAKSADEVTSSLIKLGQEEAKRLATIQAVVLKELEENESLKRSTEEIGKTASEINALNIARLETKLLLAEIVLNTEMATEQDVNYTESLKKQIEALKERGGLLDTKALVQSAEDSRRAMDATWKGIGEDLTNYVMSGFQNTRGLLKKMFETLVLRPIISPIMNAVSGGIQNLLGLGGGGGAGGGAGGSFLSSLFGAGSLLGGTLGIGGELQLAGTVFSNMVADGAGIFESISAAAGSLAEGGGLLGGAAELLSAIPIWGWIALAAGALAMYFGADETGIKIDNSVTDGRGRKDIINSALGSFDVSGDIDNKVFAPLIKSVNALDAYIADNLLSPDTLEKVRANIQAISSDMTDWFGFDDEASAKVAIEKASKLFLQQRYSVAFDEIDASVAQMIRTFGGTAEELLVFINKAVVAKGVIDALNKAIPALNVALGTYLSLTEQQQQDLATIATLMPLLGQDIAQLGADAYAAQTRGVVDSFIAQGDALDTLVDKFNAGNVSINDLANATTAFGNSAIQVLIALADARAQVDANIAGGVRTIQTTGLDPEALNAFLSNEAERLRAELAVTTDPAKIQDLVNRIIANSTQVFSGLSPEEQAARRDEFITGLQTLQTEADARITTLSNLVANNTQTQLSVVKGILEAAADKIVASADTTAAAVDKFNDATDKFDHTVDKGIHVTVDLETANVGGL